MLRKVNVKFTRTATVVEHGGVCIEVPNVADIESIYKRAHEKKWKEFLTTSRKYEEEDWDFEIIGEAV